MQAGQSVTAINEKGSKRENTADIGYSDTGQSDNPATVAAVFVNRTFLY